MKLYHLVYKHRWHGSDWHEELFFRRPSKTCWRTEQRYEQHHPFILVELIRNVVVQTNFDVVQMAMYHTHHWPVKEALLKGEELPRVSNVKRWANQRIAKEQYRIERALAWQSKLRQRAEHISREVLTHGEQLTNTKG